MPDYTLYTLEEADMTISNGATLSGFTQGNGSHLVGETITLNSNLWDEVTITDDDANFNDSESGQVLTNTVTYNGVTVDAGRRVEAEYTLTLQDPSGATYTVIGFNLNEAGASNPYGTVEGLAFIGPQAGFPPIGTPLTVVSASEGPGGSATPYASYATPACFAAGTPIETASGPQRVEALEVGTEVRTLDSGFQPVRWIGRTTLTMHDLWTQPRLRPIVIAAGALGPGLPARDVIVSPMHKVLLATPAVDLLFGGWGVLAPAVHLVDNREIRASTDLSGVTYVHIAFDDHQIVQSHGLWTESFLPGGLAQAGMDAAAQRELRQLFPDAPGGDGPAPRAARPCLKRHEVEVVLARA